MGSCKKSRRQCASQAKRGRAACNGSKKECQSALKASESSCKERLRSGKAACASGAVVRCGRLPRVVLGNRVAKPLGQVSLTIENYDPTAVYAVEFDLGLGVIVRLPLPARGRSTILAIAPLGRVDAAAGFVSGDVGVVVIATTPDGTAVSDPIPLTIQPLPTWTGTPGKPTRALLAATKRLAIDAKARYESAAP